MNIDDPRNPIVKVVERDYGEEPKNGVVSFDDSDLDKGLLNKESADILEKLSLALPSKIKNEKLEVIKLYQKNADAHIDYFESLLKNKAIFYTEKGARKAKESKSLARNKKTS